MQPIKHSILKPCPHPRMPAPNPFPFNLQWQQLRQRYWSQEAGAYHRQQWAALDAATAPIRQAVPILQKPCDFMARWFQAAHPMMGRQ